MKETTPFIYYNNFYLKKRLELFYLKYNPLFLYRIPIILEAYQEHPNLIFGDLDFNYNTKCSNKLEKKLWEKENKLQKQIRVRVARDYIYKSLKKTDYIHYTENKYYLTAISYK